MCGISGFFNIDRQELDNKILTKFSELLNHRGPDNNGIYHNGHIGLSHNRLAILDLSDKGNQPFSDGKRWLVYNGEIYNFKEIRNDMIKKDISFSSNSDTEVLFKAILYYGIDLTLRKIEGMFAFAFYDSEKEEIILARDKLGIKPLFYIFKNNTIYFASELKALVSEISLELDLFRTLFSVLGIAEKSRYETLFKNLYHLPPGSMLTVNAEGLRLKKYFQISDLINEKKYILRHKSSFNDNLNEFHNIFENSVKMMLISDVPMGAFVSGGIDSSLIASHASDFADNNFKLFTANILGRYSEFEDAKLLSESLNKPLYQYSFKPEYFIRDLSKVTWHYESPLLVHNNAIPFSNVSGLAYTEGVKAVLTGEGADEMFMGYPKLLTQAYDSIIKAPYNILNMLYGFTPTLQNYMKGGASSGLENIMEKASQNFTRDLIRNEGMEKLSFLPLKQRKNHYLSIQMLNEGLVSLLWRNDRMGMMNSIESRFPYLTTDMIEFAINLPIKNKIGITGRFYNYKHPFMIDKKIIRYSGLKKLPKKLIFKKKKGFPAHGLADIKVKPELFRGGFISELFNLHTKEQENFFTENFNNYHIAKFAAVEIWGKLFAFKHSIEKVQSDIEKSIFFKTNNI